VVWDHSYQVLVRGSALLHVSVRIFVGEFCLTCCLWAGVMEPLAPMWTLLHSVTSGRLQYEMIQRMKRFYPRRRKQVGGCLQSHTPKCRSLDLLIISGTQWILVPSAHCKRILCGRDVVFGRCGYMSGEDAWF
jgi:hypothetical protein